MSGVYMGTQCIGGKTRPAEPCVDSYTLFDLTLGLQAPDPGRAQIAVQNLLDEDYRSFPALRPSAGWRW